MEEIKSNQIKSNDPILNHLARLEEKTDSQSKMLLDIYRELQGSEFSRGFYRTVQQNTSDIERIDKIQQEDHKIIEELRTIKKWSIKALWLALIAAVGKGLLWLLELLKMGWKVALAFIGTGNHHT